MQGWNRFSITGLCSATTSNFALQVTTGTASTDLSVDGLQLEVAPFAQTYAAPTAWQNPANGARAAGILQYAAFPSGKSGVTFSTWVAGTPPSPPASPYGYLDLFSLFVGSNRVAYLEFSSNSSSTSVLGWNLVSFDGTLTTLTVSQNEPNPWTHLVATYYANLSGLPNAYLYVNGALVGSATVATPILFPGFSYGSFYIGGVFNGHQLNGRLDDMQVLPFGVDQNWVTGTYNGVGSYYTENGLTPFVQATGGFNGDASVTVYGEIKKETYTGYMDPLTGLWTPNGVVLEIALTEV